MLQNTKSVLMHCLQLISEHPLTTRLSRSHTRCYIPGNIRVTCKCQTLDRRHNVIYNGHYAEIRTETRV